MSRLLNALISKDLSVVIRFQRNVFDLPNLFASNLEVFLQNLVRKSEIFEALQGQHRELPINI